jgi:hypothetical protein
LKLADFVFYCYFKPLVQHAFGICILRIRIFLLFLDNLWRSDQVTLVFDKFILLKGLLRDHNGAEIEVVF